MSEWIEWSGGECPVPPHTMVEVRYQDGSTDHWLSHTVNWDQEGTSADIVAYRVVEQKTAAEPTALSHQEGGDHYKKLAIQPVEYIHKNGIGYFEGNVIKYVTRWRNKNGVADLKKARHYIDLLIELEGKS